MFNDVTKETQWEVPTHPATGETRTRQGRTCAASMLVKHRRLARRRLSGRSRPVTLQPGGGEAMVKEFRRRDRVRGSEFRGKLAELESHCNSAKRGGDLGLRPRQ
uniref:WW domain-containing protein n=1 Tax=Macrostomum lignano TaxID=282301 RepID=A0A1I8FCV2_9PLAT